METGIEQQIDEWNKDTRAIAAMNYSETRQGIIIDRW